MPKNKGKGGKNRRRGKNENDNEKRELTFKEDGQEYAQVVKMLGYVFLLPLPLNMCRVVHRKRRLFFFSFFTLHLSTAAATTILNASLRGSGQLEMQPGIHVVHAC